MHFTLETTLAAYVYIAILKALLGSYFLLTLISLGVVLFTF